MSEGLTGIARTWGPEVTFIEGSFIVASGAINASLVRPAKLGGFTVTWIATGVYSIALDQSYTSVLSAKATVGLATNATTQAIPASAPVTNVQITQDFVKVDPLTNANYVTDTTGKNLLIVAETTGSLADPSGAYRVAFEVALSRSQTFK